MSAQRMMAAVFGLVFFGMAFASLAAAVVLGDAAR